MYKVAILAAGIGSRMGALSKEFNKALVPVGFKSVLSHVIDKFPKNIEFVIAIGHNAHLIREYCKIAHPKNKFRFIEIDKITEPGAGPGYSLLKCKKYLQCPFVLSTVDTIVLETIPEPTADWLGVAKVDDTSRFNSVKIKNGLAINMLDKVASDNTHAFIGLCGINDYAMFWKALEADDTLIKNERQLSNGLRTLVESGHGMKAARFTWFDTGDTENYIKANQYFNKNTEDFDFSKTDEFIYFQGDYVIKYFKDPELVTLRVKRADYLKGFVPIILKQTEHFYSYKKIPGTTLYNALNDATAVAFFEWLKSRFWNKAMVLDGSEQKRFKAACQKFYFTKTQERVKKYFKSTNTKDKPSIVNGYPVPKLHDLLSQIDWNHLTNGTPTRFHGDLQFDNVLYTGKTNDPFVLLDWRQEFAGLTEYGDQYYDLAKMYGGLILPYNLIKKNMFSYAKFRNQVTLDVFSTYKINRCKVLYEQFLLENNFDLKKIKLLTALIFLNMSPLHHEPFNFLLHHLGKLELQQALHGLPTASEVREDPPHYATT